MESEFDRHSIEQYLLLNKNDIHKLNVPQLVCICYCLSAKFGRWVQRVIGKIKNGSVGFARKALQKMVVWLIARVSKLQTMLAGNPVNIKKLKSGKGKGGLVSGRNIKFLCSYGDDNRIISFSRDVSFDEFKMKLKDTYGRSVDIKYQHPDVSPGKLLSVLSNDELEFMMMEYEELAESSSSGWAKLNVFLFPTKEVHHASGGQVTCGDSLGEVDFEGDLQAQCEELVQSLKLSGSFGKEPFHLPEGEVDFDFTLATQNEKKVQQAAKANEDKENDLHYYMERFFQAKMQEMKKGL